MMDRWRFTWSLSEAGGWNVGAGERLVLDLAFIPFREGDEDPDSLFTIWMDDMDTGNTFFFINFEDGVITPGNLSYSRQRWNDIRVRFNFDDQEFNVFVNGQESGPRPFVEPDMVDYTVTGISGLKFELVNTPNDEPDPAWLDAMTLTKKTATGDVEFIGAQFDANPNFDPAYGSMEYLDPETREFAQGACLTTTTLNIDKTQERIKAAGRVLPPHSEGVVTVSLFKKRDGRFVKVATKNPELDGESRYSVRFSRPNSTNRCRVRARFPAGEDYQGSETQKTFAC